LIAFPLLGDTISYTGVNAQQQFTINTSGIYQIIAFGAAGGSDLAAPGGEGAEIGGDFSLTQGETLDLYIGQQGGANTIATLPVGGGGGGGTFVALDLNGNPNTLLLAAGGGGGTGGSGGRTLNGINANLTGFGTSDTVGVLPGGSNGSGGAALPAIFGGGAGGGYLSAGGSSMAAFGGAAFPILTGGIFIIVGPSQGAGGYGGGGAGGFGNFGNQGPSGESGGGGGGYSGGAGGSLTDAGGGGGSYIDTAAASNLIELVNSTGNGEVIVDLISPASAVPEPASLVLFGLGLIALSLRLRHRAAARVRCSSLMRRPC
jgi:hypothetical protein